MDEGQFQSEKRRILNNEANWKVFITARKKIDIEASRPGHADQCPFSWSDSDKSCIEWGWPNDATHQDLALKVFQEWLQKHVGWRFRIRNVVEANLLPDHHGIGVRIDDYKAGKQYSGILARTYDAVAAKGSKKDEKPTPPKPRPQEKPVSPRKQEKEEPQGVKKSKSLKEKLGLKKSKKGDDDNGGGDQGGNNKDDDYFH